MRRALLLGATALTLCACGDRPSASAVAPLPVTVVRPEPPGAGGVESRFPARLERQTEITVSLRVGGVLRASPSRIGDRVAAGDLIAALVDTPYAQAERRAAAEVARLQRAVERNRRLGPSGAIAQADLEDSASGLDAARAAQTAAQYDLDSTVARAPFAGIVLERLKEVGETVSPGEPVLRLADQSSPWLIRASVAAPLAARLRTGGRAVVRLPGLGETQALIRRIGGRSDPRTGAVDVEISLPDQPGFASGLVGSVSFPDSQGAAPAGLAVPVEALVDAKDGAGHVFILDPARKVATLRAVQIERLAGETLVVRGLTPDMSVITDGAGFAAEGRPVTVVAR